MIGTTCGIIFIVLSALAIFHTQKLRRHRAQIRRSEVASTASFDVHQANAPPSYETGKTGVTGISGLSLTRYVLPQGFHLEFHPEFYRDYIRVVRGWDPVSR